MRLLPVLLGSDANVYGMARSFFEAYGVVSAALCKRRMAATACSRFVHVVLAEPRLEEDAVFVRTLLGFAKQQKQRHPDRVLVLVSCADGYSLLLARHQAALAPFYRFACPAEQTVRTLESKAGFYRACAENGLRCPQTVVCDAGNYAEAALPFGWPVIVKASDSAAYWNCRFAHKKKVFLAQDRAELNAVAAAIYGSGYAGQLILQEYIPGPDSQMRVLNAYCGRDGGVRLLAPGRPLLEEQTPEGIGNYAAVLTGPDVLSAAALHRIARFLQAVDWRGFANLDGKLDPRTGELVLFELNPRQGRSSYYATAAGANLARVLAEDVVFNRPARTVVLRRPWLWRIAPWGVLRRYAADKDLLRRAAALRKAGRCTAQLWCRWEHDPRRIVWYARHQLTYYAKMRRWNGNKALRG